MWQEYREGEYLISTDPALLQVGIIHGFLAEQSYWAQNIPIHIVETAIRNSLNFGIYKQDQQVGFARVISDYATFAYLCDVFVLPGFRGNGLAKWLMRCVMEHPQMQGLRRFMLMTQDAHSLYKSFGFEPLSDPTRAMAITKPGIYQL